MDSGDVLLNWVPDRSLSFNKHPDALNESWFELGMSKVKLAAGKMGTKDKIGQKYALSAYCMPVCLFLFKNSIVL